MNMWTAIITIESLALSVYFQYLKVRGWQELDEALHEANNAPPYGVVKKIKVDRRIKHE